MNNTITKKTTFAIVNDPDSGVPCIQVINLVSIEEMTSQLNLIISQTTGLQQEIEDKNSLIAILQGAIDLSNVAPQPIN